jgi:phosphatidylserine decarboxylase
LLFYVIGFPILSILAGIASVFVIFFFRDPERRASVEEDAVLAPADGKIIELRRVKGSNPLAEPAVKVSIFMTIFNVHVNRMPFAGTIKDIVYSPGKFFAASLDKASTHNENNLIALSTPKAHQIVVIQIAGLIARRIACWVRQEDSVEKGQRFGLIRFGSRLDVYLPERSRMVVQNGQKVRAGESVLGYLP